MKKILIGISILAIVFVSCNKEEILPTSSDVNNMTLLKKDYTIGGVVGDLYVSSKGQKVYIVDDNTSSMVEKAKPLFNYKYKKEANGDHEVVCPNTGTDCAKSKINGEDVLVIKKKSTQK